jgi:hypothetical protein
MTSQPTRSRFRRRLGRAEALASVQCQQRYETKINFSAGLLQGRPIHPYMHELLEEEPVLVHRRRATSRRGGTPMPYTKAPMRPVLRRCCTETSRASPRAMGLPG